MLENNAKMKKQDIRLFLYCRLSSRQFSTACCVRISTSNFQGKHEKKNQTNREQVQMIVFLLVNYFHIFLSFGYHSAILRQIIIN